MYLQIAAIDTDDATPCCSCPSDVADRAVAHSFLRNLSHGNQAGRARSPGMPHEPGSKRESKELPSAAAWPVSEQATSSRSGSAPLSPYLQARSIHTPSRGSSRQTDRAERSGTPLLTASPRNSNQHVASSSKQATLVPSAAASSQLRAGKLLHAYGVMPGTNSSLQRLHSPVAGNRTAPCGFDASLPSRNSHVASQGSSTAHEHSHSRGHEQHATNAWASPSSKGQQTNISGNPVGRRAFRQGRQHGAGWPGQATHAFSRHPYHHYGIEEVVVDSSASSDEEVHEQGCHIPVIVTHGTEVVTTLHDAPAWAEDSGSSVDWQTSGQGHQVEQRCSSAGKKISGRGDQGNTQTSSNSHYSMKQQQQQQQQAWAWGSSAQQHAASSNGDLQASMSYDDIPVVYEPGDDAETLCHEMPASTACLEEEEEYGGMTLDQFMAQMITTPASQAATSGLGQPAPEHCCPSSPPHSIGADEDTHSTLAPTTNGGLQDTYQPDGFESPVSSAMQQAAAPWPSRLSSGSWQPNQGPSCLPQSRAAKAAMLNSLDLRPATAASPSTTADSLLGGAEQSFSRPSPHQPPIKQVDLGSLPGTLFTPLPPNAQRHSSGLHMMEGALQHEGMESLAVPRALRTSLHAIPATTASTGTTSVAVGASQATHTPADLNRVLPGRHVPAWGTDIGFDNAAALAAAGAAQAARPTGPAPGSVRQVQSARPATRDGPAIDPSVWQNFIAVPLERPPSRQRPPPEALHLWSPLKDAAGGGSSAGSSQQRRPGAARPHSAAPYVGNLSGSGSRSLATSATSGDFTGGLLQMPRPPTRQKPPPMSVLKEHAEEFSASDEHFSTAPLQVHTAW